MSDNQLKRIRVKTPKARLSYPYLFVPKPAQKPDEDAKYSTALIFEAGTDLNPMMVAAMEVAHSRWPDAPQMIRGGRLHWPFRSDPGDVKEKGYPAGCTFMNASAGKNKPQVIDALTVDVPPEQAERAYAGRYCFASLTAYTFEVRGNKGVTFGLNSIQLLEDGERLDGRINAADEFDVEESALADLSDMGEQPVDAPEVAEEGSAQDALSDLMG